jgi:hypothetical protein
MANKPDMGDITKKLNIGGIINNVKSMISPGGQTPQPEDGDVVGMQLAELSLLIQEQATVNAEQAKRLAKTNQLFNAVFNTLKAERDLEAAEEAAAKEATAAKARDDAEKAENPESASVKASDNPENAENSEKPEKKPAAKKATKKDE